VPMKTPRLVRALGDALHGAARQGIERKLGGYRREVHHDDPSRPERPAGEAPRVAVIGGGIAGLSAATTLAGRGVRVTLYERERYLGGKSGAWTVDIDGEAQRVDHGFHAVFRHYYNLRAMLERIGSDRHLRPIDDYMILRQDRSRISFKGTDTTPLLNLLSLSKTGVYSVRELIFSKRMHKLDPFLRYDEARTFRDWDHVPYDDFVRDADLPRDLRLVFNTFARAFFSEGDRLSVASLVRAFHFYYLSNDGGLLYDYFDDDYETAFAAPARAWLEAHGATLHTGSPVTSIDAATGAHGRWSIGGETYDDVVIACDVVGARKLVAASPALAERHPDFTARIARQKSSQRYAILRLWVERDAGRDMPVFVITDRLRVLDAITFTHRVVPAARDWAAKRDGGVYEIHSYAVPDDLPDDAAIRRELVAEFEHFLPEVRGARIAHEHLHVRSDFAAFHVGTYADRAQVETGVAGIHLAGDWVRLSHPATLMEAACMTGALAANNVLREKGLREAPVYAVPERGILAR
jgi:isorenieratene synthase